MMIIAVIILQGCKHPWKVRSWLHRNPMALLCLCVICTGAPSVRNPRSGSFLPTSELPGIQTRQCEKQEVAHTSSGFSHGQVSVVATHHGTPTPTVPSAFRAALSAGTVCPALQLRMMCFRLSIHRVANTTPTGLHACPILGERPGLAVLNNGCPARLIFQELLSSARQLN